VTADDLTCGASFYPNISAPPLVHFEAGGTAEWYCDVIRKALEYDCFCRQPGWNWLSKIGAAKHDLWHVNQNDF